MAEARSSWVPISSVPAGFSELPKAKYKAKMTGNGNNRQLVSDHSEQETHKINIHLQGLHYRFSLYPLQ
jgi:hypothetical protein